MFKTIRRYYWLIQKFFARHYAVIFRTVLVVLIISAAMILVARYIPSTRDVRRIGIVGKYTPETLPAEIQKLVSAGLVTLDEKGEPLPALAKSWDVSDDGTRFTFILDENARWHDGSVVSPQDVLYNFKDVQVEYEPNNITFKLPEPFAPFMQAVAKPILKQGKIGTGIYRLQNTKVYSGVLQEQILLSDTEKLIYKFYPTETSAVTAFRLGEIDELENISYVSPELEKDESLLIAPNTTSSKIVVLFFNNNDSVLTSKPARQGLAYAIQDKTFGRVRALSPIDRDSWAYNPMVKEYEYDEARAKNLFFTDISKDKPPALELKTTLGYLSIAEKIAEDWRRVLGINVDVKVVTNIGADYQVLLTDYTPPADPDQYTIWHSTQTTNFTHYSNLKVDKLLEDGRRTLDKKLRTETYQDFQRFLLEDSPAVFLFNSSGYRVTRKPLFQ